MIFFKIIVLVIIVGLTSCGGSAGFAVTNITGGKSVLDGSWASTCYYVLESNLLAPSVAGYSYRDRLFFSGDALTVDTYSYSGSGCAGVEAMIGSYEATLLVSNDELYKYGWTHRAMTGTVSPPQTLSGDSFNDRPFSILKKEIHKGSGIYSNQTGLSAGFSQLVDDTGVSLEAYRVHLNAATGTSVAFIDEHIIKQ